MTAINSPRALRNAAIEDGWSAGHSAATYWEIWGHPGSLFPEFIRDEAFSNWYGRRGRGPAWLAGFWQGVNDYYRHTHT